VKVTVVLGSWAEKYVQVERVELELPDGATVVDAIEAVGVPVDAVGFGVVGGNAVRKDYKLVDGMEVALYPPIVGG